MSLAFGCLSMALVWLAAVVAVFTNVLPIGSAAWWLANAGAVAGWVSLIAAVARRTRRT